MLSAATPTAKLAPWCRPVSLVCFENIRKPDSRVFSTGGYPRKKLEHQVREYLVPLVIIYGAVLDSVCLWGGPGGVSNKVLLLRSVFLEERL